MELTEREEAIAAGLNPNEITEEVKEDVVEAQAETTTEGADASDATQATDGQDSTVQDGANGGGTEAADESWVTDDLRSYAQSYGLGDDELKQFGSADEFKRAALIFDKQLVKPPEPKTEATETATPAEKAEAKRLAKLDLKKYEEGGYDEDTLEAVRKQNEAIDYVEQLENRIKEIEPSVEAMKQHFIEQDRIRQINAFHSAVDGLDQDLFGKSLDDSGRVAQLDKKHDDNRRKLYEAGETLVAGLVARARAAGQEPNLPPSNVLLQRALQLAFADELRAKATQKIQSDVKAQSQRRRPVSGNRAVKAAAPDRKVGFDSPRDVAATLLADPEIQGFLKDKN